MSQPTMTFPVQQPITTFSIVAHDAATNDLGIAVASRFLAVGSVVPWAKAGVGAVATQSFANTTFGPEGLRLMAAGWSAPETLKHLLAFDSFPERRQTALVDIKGRAAAHTGHRCVEWAGHLIGDGFSCQGNLLIGKETVEAMFETFKASRGPLAERLVSTLMAGEQAGGDRRGRQSAALLVVRVGGGTSSINDRFVDLRVDDDEQPIARLRHLLDLNNELQARLALHRLYLFPTDPDDLVTIDEALSRELQVILSRTGHYQGPVTGIYDDLTRQALEALLGIDNMQGRPVDNKINREVLHFMRQQYADVGAVSMPSSRAMGG